MWSLFSGHTGGSNPGPRTPGVLQRGQPISPRSPGDRQRSVCQVCNGRSAKVFHNSLALMFRIFLGLNYYWLANHYVQKYTYRTKLHMSTLCRLVRQEVTD
jgi:hypothetical protein